MDCQNRELVQPYAMFVVGMLLVSVAACNGAGPAASLPPAEADAVKALEALNAKTKIDNGKVVYVDFYDVRDAASAVVHLKSLPNVEKLNFSSANMTDEALAHLADLRDLKELALNRTRITDAGLVHLAGLTKLDRLNLDETNVTDAGLAHLKDLKAMKHLHLNETKISDAGLAHLDGLQQLEWLLAFGTGVTSSGAAAFRENHAETHVVTTEGESGPDDESDSQ
jgi:hypothetical protein